MNKIEFGSYRSRVATDLFLRALLLYTSTYFVLVGKVGGIDLRCTCVYWALVVSSLS